MINRFLVFVLVISLVYGCSSGFKPQQGDVLFQDLDCGPTCDAIEQVTQGVEGANLSHIGVVYIQDNQYFVLEAMPPKVQLVPLDTFLGRSVDAQGKPKVMVGRIYSRDVKFIKKALKYGKAMLGIPYDEAFIYNNGLYYCSEMVYDMFKHASGGKPFFELQPMTFKTPNDTVFNPAWVAYYKALNQTIPEGEMGINPAGISRAEHLKIVHRYGELSKKIIP